MESNEIRRKFYSPNIKFYGRMYGTTSPDDKIIEIDKNQIKFDLDGTAFCTFGAGRAQTRIFIDSLIME